MANTASHQHPQQALLDNLPSDTVKVQVTDASGKPKWREPPNVRMTDTINLKSSGDPIVMRSPPGRRQRVVPLPPVNQATAAVVQQKDDTLRKDPLLRAAKDNPHGLDVLDHIITGISEEAASLHFERQEAERKGNETSKISLRRVNALKAAADVYLKRRDQLSSGIVDLDGEAFQKLFLFIIETLGGSLVGAGMAQEQVDALFATASKSFDDGWKAEARARMTQD